MRNIIVKYKEHIIEIPMSTRGAILNGPNGVGKSLISKAVCQCLFYGYHGFENVGNITIEHDDGQLQIYQADREALDEVRYIGLELMHRLGWSFVFNDRDPLFVYVDVYACDGRIASQDLWSEYLFEETNSIRR